MTVAHRIRPRRVVIAFLACLGLSVIGVAPSAGAADREVVLPGTATVVVFDPPAGVERSAREVRLRVGAHTLALTGRLADGVSSGSVQIRIALPGGGRTDPDAVGARLQDGTAEVLAVTQGPRIGPQTGTHHVLVVPVYWDARPMDTADELQAVLREVDSYYDRATAGQYRFTADQIRSWTKLSLTADEISTCAYDAIESKVRDAIGSSYPTDATHHVLAYMAPMESCWWGGLATMGTGADSSFLWINHLPESRVWAHEFGHNLDLQHSGDIICWNAAMTATMTLSDDCRQETYQDPWDLMGAQPMGAGMISAENLRRLGALPSSASTVISYDTELTLAPVEGSTGVRGAEVPDGETTYFLEYRIPAGLDSYIDGHTYNDDGVTRTEPGGGLVVRRLQPGFGQEGEQDVLDFHAGNYVYQRHPGMEPGESYTLPNGHVQFSVVSASSAGAKIRVTFPAAGGVTRWSGSDRYATAATISRATFVPGVATLYIASGENYADALSAAAVAGRDHAPLLLVRRDLVPAPTFSELYRLQPRRVVVLGGPAAISDEVFASVNVFGHVARVAGPDRYATSAMISAATMAGGVDTAYISSGVAFPDALSGAPIAGQSAGPMLLTDPRALPPVIATELRRLHPRRIVVLGGPAAVSEAVATALDGFAGSGGVDRWSGPDRFAVSAAISARAFPHGAQTVFVASGLLFPDSLSGAPVAGATPGPLLLVSRDEIAPAVAVELTRLAPKRIVILGGPSSVGTGVETRLHDFL